MNSRRKHTALTEDDVSRTKQTLMRLSHRLRMQIPSELIDVSRDRLLSADDVQSELEALSSLRLAHSERVVDLLKEVDRAITRINDETYGICTKCGGEIDKQSLLKNITEDRCANCRADEESERGG